MADKQKHMSLFFRQVGAGVAVFGDKQGHRHKSLKTEINVGGLLCVTNSSICSVFDGIFRLQIRFASLRLVARHGGSPVQVLDPNRVVVARGWGGRRGGGGAVQDPNMYGSK